MTGTPGAGDRMRLVDVHAHFGHFAALPFRASTPPSSADSAGRVSDYAGDAEQQIGTLLQALLQRGIDDGTFRGDLTAGELLFLLGSLLEAAARMTAEHLAGVDKAAALVTSVFLHGTQNRAGPAPRQGQDQG